MLKTTPFHIVYATGEEHEPIEFFFDALLESKTFDLGLGYFSSSAISALSAGFAYFIHRGGKMRIIINDILSQKDKDAIEQAINSEVEFEEAILQDIKQLFKTLSKQDEHFFKCLSYLISKDRIEFLATKPKNGKRGIAHNKYGIFKDEEGNKVAFNGSANFSKNALINNVESISCYKSWTSSEEDKKRLSYFENLFNKTWNGKAKNIEVIPINRVKTHIQNTFDVDDIEQLLNEEVKLISQNKRLPKRIKEKVDKLFSTNKKEPHFPIFNGKQAEPRQYQKDAYKAWINNNYLGIFAMATGTGKTITSLNCVLNEYKKNKSYNVLILVPTRALVSQWIEEAKKFNFSNIYTTQDNNWFNILSDHLFNLMLNNDEDNNIVFISTYASFNGDKFQRLMRNKGWNEFILIADEAHNMGSPRTLKNLPNNILKRIGLSATPERVYDEKGSNKIYEFFNSKPPCYTYSYSMYKAITQEPTVLTKYFYYPYFTHLNEKELVEYNEITKQLYRNYDPKT
ncbi:MAG: DEAD/DEAH box helicase family protein, partial [Chlorobi bacterium]|nr:DEAD/DEAH box helicase family protein [Chlorobiota bacterium]